MKDVRIWIDKSRSSLDAPQHKKKPLRDQLGILEKMLADIAVQKTKITMSIEKLQVDQKQENKRIKIFII